MYTAYKTILPYTYTNVITGTFPENKSKLRFDALKFDIRVSLEQIHHLTDFSLQ